MPVKKGLGRGLSALISDTEEEYDGALKESDNTPKDAAVEISISLIDPNVNQPRKNFDDAGLLELTNSIRVHGIISPIILVPVGSRYMIISGERRYRAAKKAGLMTVPAIVRNYTQKQIDEISLIENLQREDLNPIETAIAIKKLMNEYKYTQEEVADRIGKSRPAVANTLRLLALTQPVIDLVANGKLSPGHARCLVVVEDPDAQLDLARKGMDNKVSVREFEKIVKAYLSPKPEKKAVEQSLELKDLVSRMQRVFATKVTALGNDNRGRIYIDYYNRDDLDRIVEIVETVQKTKPPEME
ncbi:MAG: ParB/RepB/Spo0J family partition protein [Clostridia bacterium]|nr:ParB/RepB/Spo0J family partition protein [Clostridia bacterium]